MSYHYTQFIDSSGGAWVAGDIVHLGDWPFADAVILGFDDDGYAALARPYLYVSGAGTVPTPLTGVERITGIRMSPYYTRVDQGRTI